MSEKVGKATINPYVTRDLEGELVTLRTIIHHAAPFHPAIVGIRGAQNARVLDRTLDTIRGVHIVPADREVPTCLGNEIRRRHEIR